MSDISTRFFSIMSKIVNGDTMIVEVIDETNYEKIIKKTFKRKDIKNLILFIDEEINMLDKISWIWSVNLEVLSSADKIYCCGKRNKDLFLKLKLDNINDNLVLENDYKKILQNIKLDFKTTKIFTSGWSAKKLKDFMTN